MFSAQAKSHRKRLVCGVFGQAGSGERRSRPPALDEGAAPVMAGAGESKGPLRELMDATEV